MGFELMDFKHKKEHSIQINKQIHNEVQMTTKSNFYCFPSICATWHTSRHVVPVQCMQVR